MIEIQNDISGAVNRIMALSKIRPTVENAVSRSNEIASAFSEGPAAIVQNFSTTTIEASLKRTLILNETIRDFATRVLPLRLFASSFQSNPLQGLDTVTVPYYPLQATASLDFSTTTNYLFTSDNTTNKAQITVNKRKYQPLDYSSQDFQRQPWFNSAQLGKMNAERLGVDVLNDVLSVVTAANYGAAVKTVSAANITSDDIADVRGSCNTANWPDAGRALIVDASVDTALQKDSAYRLTLNIGTSSVIQQGKFPNISGFDYAWMPSLPTNGEKLIGFAAFQSAILAAFAPIMPAPGVRAQLIAYEIATDPATGISLNYRHWGLAQADRDYEVIECAYGYAAGVPAALKRIVAP